MRRCHELHRRGLELAERFGQVRGIRFLSAELGLDAYTLGDWDEAVRRADALLAEVESGSPHYMESGVRSIRATILGARGDMTRALSEMSRALEHARELGEPQVVLPTLAAAAVLFVDAGNEQESAAILDKLSGETEYESVWFWAVPGVFAYERLGRTAEVLAAVTGDAARTSRWVEAAGLYAQRDFAVAADALEEIGSLPDAARARVRAAEELVAAGRRAEADVQLGRALAFYRVVGATRHLHAAEALLAASA